MTAVRAVWRSMTAVRAIWRSMPAAERFACLTFPPAGLMVAWALCVVLPY